MSHADIYKYTDKIGTIHFTNIDPKKIPRKNKRWKRILRTGPGKARAIHAKRRRRLSRARYTRYNTIISEAATLYSLPVALIRAVIRVESDFDAQAKSSVGARGLMQLMPKTAKGLGVENVHNPRENIFGGSRYLRKLANRYKGDLALTLAGYHAGPNAVKKYKGIPPYKTTHQYVHRVLKRYQLESRSNR